MIDHIARIEAETQRTLEKMWRRRDRKNNGVFGYINSALQQIYDPTTGTIPGAAIPGGSVADHVAAGDPHTQYARTYAVDVGDGMATTITVTHNLGTRDVIVMVHKAASSYDAIICEVKMATTNTVTLTFDIAPSTAEFRCVVLG